MSLLCHVTFAMSVLCNCFAYALFLLCVNYLLQTTGNDTDRTSFEDKMRTFFSSVYEKACQREIPFVTPDAVLRTFKNNYRLALLVGQRFHDTGLKSVPVHRFSLGRAPSRKRRVLMI